MKKTDTIIKFRGRRWIFDTLQNAIEQETGMDLGEMKFENFTIDVDGQISFTLISPEDLNKVSLIDEKGSKVWRTT